VDAGARHVGSGKRGDIAVVHPPFAALPVFGLGVATALVYYDRTRLLLAPMAAHAVYNGIMVGYQWLL